MFFELRTYDFTPGNAIRYAERFRQDGLPPITTHLPLLGHFLTEGGPLNRLHHLWVYRDLSERAEKRADLMADKAWIEGFLPRGLAMIQRQETRLLSLIESSDDLEAIVAKASMRHEAQDAAMPMLSEAWFQPLVWHQHSIRPFHPPHRTLEDHRRGRCNRHHHA